MSGDCGEWSLLPTPDIASSPAQGATGTVRISLTPGREAHCAALGGGVAGASGSKETGGRGNMQGTEHPRQAGLASTLHSHLLAA